MGKCKIFKNNWVKYLILPVLASVISYIIFVYFIEGLNKSKTGEVQIFCNVDSTEVYLDGEFKGITGPSDKIQNMFVLKITSVDPGSYPLVLKKEPFPDLCIHDIIVKPGNRTSKRVNLTPLSSKEKYCRIEMDDMDKKSILPKVKNEIRSKIPNDNEKQDNPESTTKTMESNLTENNEKAETNKSNITEKPKNRKLTLKLTNEIQLSEIKISVNSKNESKIPSYQFTINLDEGLNTITLTYTDEIKILHTYSKTINVLGNDTLIIKRNEFKPKI